MEVWKQQQILSNMWITHILLLLNQQHQKQNLKQKS